MTRCKFEVNSITEWNSQYEYRLTPVFGSEENRAFWEMTPSGALTLSISKIKGKVFEVGKAYYVDISEAPSQTAPENTR